MWLAHFLQDTMCRMVLLIRCSGYTILIQQWDDSFPRFLPQCKVIPLVLCWSLLKALVAIHCFDCSWIQAMYSTHTFIDLSSSNDYHSRAVLLWLKGECILFEPLKLQHRGHLVLGENHLYSLQSISSPLASLKRSSIHGDHHSTIVWDL